MEWKRFFFTVSICSEDELGDDEDGPGWTDPDDTPGWFWSSIRSSINSALEGFLSLLSAPFNLIGEALDSVGEGIETVWNEIKDLPSKIANAISDLFSYLFVPGENFFSDKFNQIKEDFTNKVGLDASALDDLKDISSGDMADSGYFEGVINGKRVKFVDFSFMSGFITKFHDVVRGFVYPLLVLYNMNQIYFLIRGVDLFGRGKGDD